MGPRPVQRFCPDRLDYSAPWPHGKSPATHSEGPGPRPCAPTALLLPGNFLVVISAVCGKRFDLEVDATALRAQRADKASVIWDQSSSCVCVCGGVTAPSLFVSALPFSGFTTKPRFSRAVVTISRHQHRGCPGPRGPLPVAAG